MWNNIISEVALQVAWSSVREGGDTPGIDKVTFSKYEKNLNTNINKLHQQLNRGLYKAKPVREIRIKELNGKMRNISIFCVEDRIVQRSISNDLEKILEPHFSDNSFAYRPRRSCKDVAERVLQFSEDGYIYILLTDIKDFFENINHKIMNSKLEGFIDDAKVLKLINQFMTVDIFDGKNIYANERGLCQGGPISPILSNLYLDEFDKMIGGLNIKYIRYSDDILCMAKGLEDLLEVEKILMDELFLLNLDVKKEKRRQSTFTEGFIFLGYCFSEKGISVPVESLKDLELKLNDIFLESDVQDLSEFLKKASLVINGWKQYYGIPVTEPVTAFDYYICLQEALKAVDISRFNELWDRRKEFENAPKQFLEFVDNLNIPSDDSILQNLSDDENYYDAYKLAYKQNMNKSYTSNKPIISDTEKGSLPMHVLSEEIEAVLKGCCILKELSERCLKAQVLNHNTRYLLACTFGHMGEEGKAFVHYLLRNTDNYSKQITDSYLKRLFLRPMGCERIRSELQTSPGFSLCTICEFSLEEGQYPSPLLYSNIYSNKATISKQVTQSFDEIGDLDKQIQQLVTSLMDLNGRKRELDMEIANCEKNLCNIFDSAQINEFSISHGKLQRIKKEDKWVWQIIL
ncbi:UNVERIFIED_CONTAM: group II intron reverse transcriptase/maturase [Acetivibrio alkalicellulosi]